MRYLLLIIIIIHGIWCWLLVRNLFSDHYSRLKKIDWSFLYFADWLQEILLEVSLLFRAEQAFFFSFDGSVSKSQSNICKISSVFCTTHLCPNDHWLLSILILLKHSEFLTSNHCKFPIFSFLCVHFSRQIGWRLLSFFCLSSRTQSGLSCFSCQCLYWNMSQEFHFTILQYFILVLLLLDTFSCKQHKCLVVVTSTAPSTVFMPTPELWKIEIVQNTWTVSIFRWLCKFSKLGSHL